MNDDSLDERSRPNLFPNTLWTQILQAGLANSRSDAAFSQLFATYQPVLLKFAHSLGLSDADAHDLVGELFAKWLRRDDLAQRHPSKGRFRTWLIHCLKNALRDWHRSRQRRPDARIEVWLDDDENSLEPVAHREGSPGDAFDRLWFASVLENARAALTAEQGDTDGFTPLFASLQEEGSHPDYAALAAELGLPERALRKRLHLMRKRLRELIEAEVGKTCEPSEVKREVAYYFSLLADG